jgi:uncharacterized membrane protein
MKQTLLAAAMAFGLSSMGCGNKSEPGGVNADSTFTISTPGTATHLKPNSKKDVSVDIKRKDTYKEAIVLSCDAPKGLKVDPATKTAEPSIKEMVFTVMAEENAQPGDYVIKVSAKPQTGKETITDLKITVDKP